MTQNKAEIARLRDELLGVDVQVLKLLERRTQLSRQLARQLEGEPVAMDGAEAEWLSFLESQSAGELPKESLVAIFRQVLASGRGIEQPVRVAYVGTEGSFGYEVTRGHFGPSPLLECATAPDALEQVTRGRAGFAVLPFESSVDGLVHPSITALVQTDLVIVAERSLSAAYDLMGHTSAESGVSRVYATPTAHTACEKFIDQKLPEAEIVDVRSPVEAAQLARGNSGAGAIVPQRCGQAAELSVIESNIADAPDQRLRYALVSQRPAPRSGRDITCLLFSVDDQAGALYDVLRHFAERGINMSKLQSRPVKSPSWDYVFYVELDGHVTDRPLVTAIEAVKGSTKYLKVLGSFPEDV